MGWTRRWGIFRHKNDLHNGHFIDKGWEGGVGIDSPLVVTSRVFVLLTGKVHRSSMK